MEGEFIFIYTFLAAERSIQNKRENYGFVYFLQRLKYTGL